ncbi:DUF2637 domain-containing protein, partial [Streptomyces asoensis]
LMPLRLARYGVPLAETAPAGLAAAGIEPPVLPAAQVTAAVPPQQLAAADPGIRAVEAAPAAQQARQAQPLRQQPAQAGYAPAPEEEQSPWFQAPHEVAYQGGYDPTYDPSEQYDRWYEEQRQAEQYQDQYLEEPPVQEPSPEETGSFPIPVVPGRSRELGEGGGPPEPDDEAYYQVFRQSIDGSYPTPRVLGDNIQATYGTTMSPSELKNLAERFQQRHTAELEEDHIA